MDAKSGSVLPTTPRIKGITVAGSIVNGRLTSCPKEGCHCPTLLVVHKYWEEQITAI